MVDSEIRPGDVCFDLSQGSKLQVVEIAAETVAEYREREDFDLTTYKSHPLFDVTDDETVYTCVFLRDSVGIPSQSYAFPRSRLARIPVEEANADLERVQDALVVDVLERLLTATTIGRFQDAIESAAIDGGVGEGLVEEAAELAKVKRTIRGEE